jgi:hypothetical protein
MSVETMLERLVPEPQAFGDWQDVLQRAGITKHALPPRKVLAAATAAVLLVVLFATPAFGVLLDLIGRTNVPFTGKAAPTRVQRTFFDMSVASPPGMGPHAIASETRRIGVLAGRALYVSPTRDGGFCWEFERASGGCDTDRRRPLSTTWALMEHRGGPVFVQKVAGELLAPKARSLEVEYADGTATQIPFIWVTKPIDAGFFLYAIPAAHRRGAARAVAVSARDATGKVVARERMIYTRPHLPIGKTPPVPPSYRPPPPLPAPTAPLQRGSANGVTVVVGANGIAEFHVSNPSLQKADWACLKFMRYHQVDPLELGYARQAVHGRRIELGNLRGPFDGCEVRPGRGHTWPDPLGYHSGAEIAFTPRGKRYFADRAAARELALYLRWSKHHPNAPTTGITVSHHGADTTYSVRSTTGKRFSVTKRGGRIVRENVRPYAGPL